jgi:hypothetical protein
MPKGNKFGEHHAAQLNLLLRQEIDDAPDWAFQAEDTL